MAAFIGILSFIAFIIGIVALIKGGMPRLGIKNRLVGLLVTVLSFLLLIIMIVSDSPEPAPEIVGPSEEIEKVVEGLEEIEAADNNDDDSSHLEYISLIAANSQGMGAALTELGELTSAFELTDDWISAAALQVAIIRFYADEAEKIVPPDKYKEVHETYLQGTGRFKESMDWLVEGIDELDVEKINKAGELMQEGTSYIEQATEKLLALE